MSRARLRRLEHATTRVEGKTLSVVGMLDDLLLADDDPASIQPAPSSHEPPAETGAKPGAAQRIAGLRHDRAGPQAARLAARAR
jgi:hypothetical protein